MKILLYNPDNGVTRNFMPHLWMFLLKALTPPEHEVLLIDGNAKPPREIFQRKIQFICNRDEQTGSLHSNLPGFPGHDYRMYIIQLLPPKVLRFRRLQCSAFRMDEFTEAGSQHFSGFRPAFQNGKVFLKQLRKQ